MMRPRFRDLAVTLLPLIVAAVALFAIFGSRGRARNRHALKTEQREDDAAPDATGPGLRTRGLPNQPLAKRTQEPAQLPAEQTSLHVTVTGRVEAADTGLPLKAAHVIALRDGIPIARADAPLDEEGRFKLTLPTDAPAVVSAVANGYLPWSEGEPLGDTRELLIRLHPGLPIAGRVLDQRGRGVPQAVVWSTEVLHESGWPHPDGAFTGGDRSTGGRAVTDATGAFRLGGHVQGHRYQVLCRKPNWIRFGRRCTAVAGDLHIGLSMRMTARLGYRVTDAETSAPVAGVRSTTYQPARYGKILAGLRSQLFWDIEPHSDVVLASIARVLPEGDDEVPEGVTTLVRVEAPGYEPRSVELPVSFGRLIIHDIRLHRTTRALRALVLDARWDDDTPFSGRLVFRGGGLHQLVRFVGGKLVTPIRVPAETGSFTLHGSRTTGYWWRPLLAPVVIPDEHLQSATVVRLRGQRIEISVVDEGGRVVTDYGLSIRPSAVGGEIRDYAAGCARELVSLGQDASGQRSFVVLHPGTFEVFARGPEKRFGKTTVVVRPSRAHPPIEIRLTEKYD